MEPIKLEERAGVDFLIPYFLLGLACDTPIVESLCYSLPPRYLHNYIQRSLYKNRIRPLLDGRFHIGSFVKVQFGYQYLTVSYHGVLDEYYYSVLEKRKLLFHRYWHPTVHDSRVEVYDSVDPWLSEMEACLATRDVLSFFCDELQSKFGIDTRDFNPLARQQPAILFSSDPSLRLCLHRMGNTLEFTFEFQSTTGSPLGYYVEVVKTINEFGFVWMVKIQHFEAPLCSCMPLDIWLKVLPTVFAKIPYKRDNSPKQSRRKVRSGGS
jgi:hypothetical protein